MVAMRKRIPYVGITCSDLHSTELFKHILLKVKAAMADPDDSLYRAELNHVEGGDEPKTKKTRTSDASGSSSGGKAGGSQNALMHKLKALMTHDGKNDPEEEEAPECSDGVDD